MLECDRSGITFIVKNDLILRRKKAIQASVPAERVIQKERKRFRDKQTSEPFTENFIPMIHKAHQEG
ncbi:hypothetical protein KTT_23390 [Tengunoibacter tsumagoiensis]|uniref:Uncharacterized protein n=1 Tax=Tengunoibacter tsumagoiensis TaxID=2014871 RepID=A0A402A012_9CHLR|nr:hypothetical protein KTT_23390 [Tengunoibacter tsumagoiensis]